MTRAVCASAAHHQVHERGDAYFSPGKVSQGCPASGKICGARAGWWQGSGVGEVRGEGSKVDFGIRVSDSRDSLTQTRFLRNQIFKIENPDCFGLFFFNDVSERIRIFSLNPNAPLVRVRARAGTGARARTVAVALLAPLLLFSWLVVVGSVSLLARSNRIIMECAHLVLLLGLCVRHGTENTGTSQRERTGSQDTGTNAHTARLGLFGRRRRAGVLLLGRGGVGRAGRGERVRACDRGGRVGTGSRA
ncbi:hypothetical protein BC828DRAFT_59619 [Blastocladiella britannica]|nr:hypothetical protein BC828DRAFT_59619 [Blastocladiella britannica]